MIGEEHRHRCRCPSAPALIGGRQGRGHAQDHRRNQESPYDADEQKHVLVMVSIPDAIGLNGGAAGSNIRPVSGRPAAGGFSGALS
jgi:hypothetical protein